MTESKDERHCECGSLMTCKLTTKHGNKIFECGKCGFREYVLQGQNLASAIQAYSKAVRKAVRGRREKGHTA